MGLLDRNHFLLGIFGPNTSSGMCVTKVPERWNNTWENNLKLAKMVEEAGIDFILPVARWIGHGGETNYNGNVLECFTWASAIAASTTKVCLIDLVLKRAYD